MNVTTTPAPKSSLQLEVELPPERLDRAVGEAVRRLARRTRVPGFRPGKAPRVMLERVLGPGAVLDEAVEQLVDDAFREAAIERSIIPLTNPQVEVVQAEEGKPLVFKATVQVRPEVKLGDYKGFGFRPEIDPVDDAKVDHVVDELRDSHATLTPVQDRGAQKGDYAVIGFVGTRDGAPFPGGSSERMPLVIGEDRLIPGFEDHLVGVRVGGDIEFDVTFPEDYGEGSLRGQVAHFAVRLRELREKVLPPADDELARSMGDYADLPAMRADVRQRLERNALDRARHDFADRIIEYAVANATLELPDVLVDQETEVMHDELRSALARQGITEEAYLKATAKADADLHSEFRPQAEKRVKTLLVLTTVAEGESVTVPDKDVEAEIERARGRYGDEPKLMRYFESERGRNYLRSTLRRTRVVEKLVDEWLTAHPEHPPIPHLEDDPGSALDEPSAGSAAAIDATDPGSVMASSEAVAAPEAVAATEPEVGV